MDFFHFHFFFFSLSICCACIGADYTRTHRQAPVKVIKSGARGEADITEPRALSFAGIITVRSGTCRELYLRTNRGASHLPRILEVTGVTEGTVRVLPSKVQAVMCLPTVSQALGKVLTHWVWGMETEQRIQTRMPAVAPFSILLYKKKTASV